MPNARLCQMPPDSEFWGLCETSHKYTNTCIQRFSERSGRKKEGTIAAKHRYPHTQTCPWVCSGEILRLWFGPQTFGWLRKKYAMDFNDKLPIQNVQLYKVFEPTEFVNHKGHWDMHSDLEELIVKIIIWYNVLFFCPLKCIHQIFVLPSIKSGKM